MDTATIAEAEVFKSQDTKLRMPKKWYICKESQEDTFFSVLPRLSLRPAADRAVSILPWVVSLGRSYWFLWAGSIIKIKRVRRDNPIPAYSPVSDRRRLTAVVKDQRGMSN
jgi:hypothetical protein